MSADLKPGVARLRFGSRNEALETALADLLKRNLLTMDLKFDPPGALKWVELRRPRDEAVMAWLVLTDEESETLVQIYRDFLDALKSEDLAPREGEGLDLPVTGGEEIARGVARALESSLKRADDQTADEQSSRDPVWDLWDLLRREAGSVSAPADWSLEHDHYLYGTPKRAKGEDKE